MCSTFAWGTVQSRGVGGGGGERGGLVVEGDINAQGKAGSNWGSAYMYVIVCLVHCRLCSAGISYCSTSAELHRRHVFGCKPAMSRACIWLQTCNEQSIPHIYFACTHAFPSEY